MAQTAAANPAPPLEVLVEFLYALQGTVNAHDGIVPVLRGSTLMKGWFGDAARPAGDIDLEWFPAPDWGGGRFASPVEQARALCMMALSHHRSAPIEFDEILPVPTDGINLWLWDYGTPGVRYYTGWRWAERNLTGVLQIDIAQAGSYDFTGVAPEPIDLPRAWGDPARPFAYTPEMLLAAKLSWIVRQARPSLIAVEPKDLFDAHLLLTLGRLRPEVFQNALLAVVLEDKLDWNLLDVLDAEDGFSNDHSSNADRMRTVAVRSRSLMGDLTLHAPFLRMIQADPTDEANLLIYADWLDERADARAEFLRLFCGFYFHEDRRARARLASSLSAQPGGWLYHVLGGGERARNLRKRIEAA